MVACPGARHEQEAAQFLKMNADVRVLSELADGCLDGTLYVSIQLCIFRQKPFAIARRATSYFPFGHSLPCPTANQSCQT